MHRNFDSNMREAEFWVLGPVFAWGFPFGRRGMVVDMFTMVADGNDGKVEKKAKRSEGPGRSNTPCQHCGWEPWDWDLPIGGPIVTG